MPSQAMPPSGYAPIGDIGFRPASSVAATLIQKRIQRERVRHWPGPGGDAAVIDAFELFQRIAVEFRHIDPLPHGRRETSRRVLLKRPDPGAPVFHRRVVGPAMHLQQMDQHQVQETHNRMKLRQAHVLDLLDNVSPVDVVHALPARQTAQEVGLMFGPGDDVALIQTV
jgi:hypothetical protein